jgi:hypothetical protein
VDFTVGQTSKGVLLPKNEEEKNQHNNAAALIIAAAEKSGFLKEVAEALCFIDKNPEPRGMCKACVIREELEDIFDRQLLRARHHA